MNSKFISIKIIYSRIHYRFQFSLPPSFLTITNFCYSGLFLQRTSKPSILVLFTCISPTKYTKECSHLFMQHASLILCNNDMKSRSSFSNGTFFKHSGCTPDTTFLTCFYQKDICDLYCLRCCYFYTAFCSKLFTVSHFLTIAYGRSICKHIFVLDIRYLYAHSPASQIAQR